jgi:hypothetical protein
VDLRAEEPEAPVTDVTKELELAARGGLAIVGVVSGAAYAGSAFNRYLVNDDYAGLYTAWQESVNAVPGRDFVVYSDHVFMHVLAVMLRWWPESFTSLYLFRLAMVVCLGAICVLVFRITSRLFDTRSAWFAPPCILLSMLVMNRALDLRSDLVTTLLWTAALDIIVGPLAAPNLDRRATFRLLARLGIVLGLMPVNFFKTALAVPILLGLLAVQTALGSRQPRSMRVRRAALVVAIVAGVSLVPVLFYAVYLGASGALPSVLDASRSFFGTMALAPDPAIAREASFRAIFENDPWICIAIMVGGVLRLDSAAKYSAAANAGVAGVLVLSVVSVMLNPAYYEYNFVTLLPLLAPFGGHACARVFRLAEGMLPKPVFLPLTALVFLLMPLCARLSMLFDVGFVPTNAHQLALHRYLSTYVPRDQGLFALDGVGVFRPSVVHFWLTFLIRPRYEAGEFDYAKELRARPAALVLKNYRLPAWLTPRDRAFVAAHYVDLNRDFMVPGAALAGPGRTRIELLVPGSYEVAGASACRLDGAVAANGRVHLERGTHELESDGACLVRLYVEPAARALLAVPTVVPYLVAPSFITG